VFLYSSENVICYTRVYSSGLVGHNVDIERTFFRAFIILYSPVKSYLSC
jgi:hypothetical protein